MDQSWISACHNSTKFCRLPDIRRPNLVALTSVRSGIDHPPRGVIARGNVSTSDLMLVMGQSL